LPHSPHSSRSQLDQLTKTVGNGRLPFRLTDIEIGYLLVAQNVGN
jgi:hypothetical protein